jgi:hypothetical protein
VGRFLLICLGGAAGTAARYLLGGWTQRTWDRVPLRHAGREPDRLVLMAIIMYTRRRAACCGPT